MNIPHFPVNQRFDALKVGMNRRLVIAVMCVPMPPLFLDLPLRQMMLPFIGRLPVIHKFVPYASCLEIKSWRN